MLVILPLAGTLTAFYVWTLNALNLTMKDLVARKQTVKAMMYRKLWWCILVSILVIFGFFFLNSFSFAGRNDPDFVPDNWQTRWFVLDGWLNLVYLIDLAFIAYIWRPTANNRRFAMSDEVRPFFPDPYETTYLTRHPSPFAARTRRRRVRSDLLRRILGRRRRRRWKPFRGSNSPSWWRCSFIRESSRRVITEGERPE